MELSKYVVERLREDEEFILYRGHAAGADPTSILMLGPVPTHPRLDTLQKIDHEYSLRRELNGAWAVQPLELSRYDGQQVLVFRDPGGEPLDRLIHGPMDVDRFLRIAIGLATALGQLHQRQLIHKDIKPLNILLIRQ